MVRSADSLESQLLILPPADHARLAELLLASLDDDVAIEPAAAIEETWNVEAMRRLSELQAGTVTGIPASRVFAEARERLARSCRCRRGDADLFPGCRALPSAPWVLATASRLMGLAVTTTVAIDGRD